MAYGLKIRNTKTELQIDGDYVNYVYNGQSGSLSLNGLQTVNLTKPSKYPPIALVRPTGGTQKGCGVFDYAYTAPNYTGIRFFGGYQIGTASGTCSFDYKIYTVTEEPSVDTHGFRVKNAEGRIVFDARNIPFKILEVGTATMNSTYTHGDYVSPYYVFSPWLSGVYGIPTPSQGPLYRLVCGLSKQSTTSVKGVWIIAGVLGLINMETEDYQGSTFTLIICDTG